VFNFEKLEIWQEAMALVEEVYALSQGFPQRERYGLTAQLRRSAISIPSNIAEGSGKRTKKEFLQFAYTARSSLLELVTQVKIARNLGLLDDKSADEVLSMMERLYAKICNFIKYLSGGRKNSKKSTVNGEPLAVNGANCA